MALVPGNPVVGGTTLIRAAINSPNYVLNVTGWAIRQDGTAQFTGLVLIGGTFTGTNFIINTHGSFFYSSAPAQGNLIASVASANGTDSKGNVYYAGICAYQAQGPGFTVAASIAQLFKGSLNFGTNGQLAGTGGAFPAAIGLDATNDPGVLLLGSGMTAAGDAQAFLILASDNAGGGAGNNQVRTASPFVFLPTTTPPQQSGPAVFGDSNGYLQVLPAVSSSDPTVYQAGQKLYLATTTTLINSTTPIAIAGVAANAGAVTYHVRGMITGVAAASGTVQSMAIRFHGSATISSMRITTNMVQEALGSTVNTGSITSLDTDPSVIAGTWPNSSVWAISFEGTVTFSAAGTFGVLGRQVTSSADETWTVQAGSYMIMTPAA